MALTVLALALLSGCASDGGEELGVYTLAEVRSSGGALRGRGRA